MQRFIGNKYERIRGLVPDSDSHGENMGKHYDQLITPLDFGVIFGRCIGTGNLDVTPPAPCSFQ